VQDSNTDVLGATVNARGSQPCAPVGGQKLTYSSLASDLPLSLGKLTVRRLYAWNYK